MKKIDFPQIKTGLPMWGFTLVELLIVMAIIVTLSAAIFASISNARADSRDESRLQVLQTMQVALQTYYADNGRYPEGCGDSRSWSGPEEGYGYCTGPYIKNLAPIYIPELPRDQYFLGEYPTYLYMVSADGQNYKLLAHALLENLRIPNDEEYSRYSSNCGHQSEQQETAAVYSEGARCW